MSLLKEDRGTCLEDERAPSFGRRIDLTMTLSQLTEAVCPKVGEGPHSTYRSGLLCWRHLLQHRGRVREIDLLRVLNYRMAVGADQKISQNVIELSVAIA
jgi:hypothetical protein